MILENVEGVSEAKAEKLREKCGIHLAEDLAGANAAMIDDIDGLSPKIVANAIRHCGLTGGKMNHKDINFKCGHCGKHYGLNTGSYTKIHQNEKCDQRPQVVEVQ